MLVDGDFVPRLTQSLDCGAGSDVVDHDLRLADPDLPSPAGGQTSDQKSKNTDCTNACRNMVRINRHPISVSVRLIGIAPLRGQTC